MRTLKVSLQVMLQPAEGLWQLRDGFNLLLVPIVVGLVLASRALELSLTSFPYSTLDPREMNLGIEEAKIFVPWASWCVAHYSIATLFYGESRFLDIVAGSTLALLPYAIFAVPLAILSNGLILDEQALYVALWIAVWGWVAWLFFRQVQVLHDFDVRTTLLVIALSVLGMLAIWVVIGALYLLSSQVIGVVRDISLELFYHGN